MTHKFIEYLDHLSSNINESLEIIRAKKSNILIKEFDNLVIFKYQKKYDDEAVRSCRGLILDKNTKKVVCQSNTGTLSFEEFIKNVPINNCVIEENLEGTLMNVYYYNGRWNVSTKFCINAENSKFRGNKSFRQYFDKLCTIDWDTLDINFTYSFLLQIPVNRLVSKITKKKLYHIETHNNITGDKIYFDIGMDKPAILKLNDLNTLNISSYRDLNRELIKLNWAHRGFMLYSGDRKYRCSLINPAYAAPLELVKNQVDIKYVVLNSLYYKENINDLLYYFPEYSSIKKVVSESINNLTDTLLKTYKDTYCFKNKELSEIPPKYKKILSDIHKVYKSIHRNNILFKISYGDVKDTLLKKDCPYVYTLLYK